MSTPRSAKADRPPRGSSKVAKPHLLESAAIEQARIDRPRGEFTLSKAHKPEQNIYLRQLVGKENKLVGVASKALAGPARG